jgi:hypothetical protein
MFGGKSVSKKNKENERGVYDFMTSASLLYHQGSVWIWEGIRYHFLFWILGLAFRGDDLGRPFNVWIVLVAGLSNLVGVGIKIHDIITHVLLLCLVPSHVALVYFDYASHVQQ